MEWARVHGRGTRRAVRRDDADHGGARAVRGAELFGEGVGGAAREREGAELSHFPNSASLIAHTILTLSCASRQKKFLTKDDGAGQHGFRSGDGSVWDDDELVGHCVFELWVEHDEKNGVDLYKAVRIDHFAVGVGGEGEDDDDDEDGSAANGKGFATALGGFPLSGPIGGGTAVRDDEFTKVEAGGEKNDDPIANQSGFFAWRVENGIVRASHGEQRDDQTSPFPFNVVRAFPIYHIPLIDCPYGTDISFFTIRTGLPWRSFLITRRGSVSWLSFRGKRLGLRRFGRG